MVKSGLDQKLCGFFKVSGYIGGLMGVRTYSDDLASKLFISF
jgi:hypothetical protein